jgi:hypothetical protein
MAEPIVTLRTEAQKHFEYGFIGLLAAFNLADCRDWKFSKEVRTVALEHLNELYRIFHVSPIRQDPKMAAVNAASGDHDFQQFLKTATKPARKRRAVKASTAR